MTSPPHAPRIPRADATSPRRRAREKGTWRYATSLLFLALTCSPGASAGLVYSALRDGAWRVFFQARLDAPPVSIGASLGGDGSAAALSPDGGRVAFEVSGRGIAVCPVADGGGCRLLELGAGDTVRPAWDPVTGGLVFVRYAASSGHEDADLFVTGADLAHARLLLSQTGIQDYPALFPDGRRLAYSSAQTLSLRRGGVQVVQQLWVMDLTSGVARQLVAGSARDIHPRWSPTGGEIAFASDRTGRFEIWVVHADGEGLRRVTGGAGSKTWPAWSPDGRALMFTRAEGGRQSLWVVDADGANPRLFEPFGRGAGIETRDAGWR